MGKEGKIGIVIIGVLMGAFLGLVIKKYFLSGPPPAIDADATQMAQQPEPIPTTEQPTVVTAQNNSTGVIPDGAWADQPSGPPSTAAGPPHGSYLPADDSTPPFQPNARYAQDADTMPAEEAVAPPVANPFDRPIAADQDTQEPEGDVPGETPDGLDAVPRRPSPLNARQPSDPRRNPLRRLSAEVPLEAPANAEPIPAVELGAPNDEPGADGLNQFEPEPNEDPLSLAPAAAPQAVPDRYATQPPFDPPSNAGVDARTDRSQNAYEPRPLDANLPDSVAPDAATALPTQGQDYEPASAAQRYAAEPAPRVIPPQPTRPVDGRYTIEPNDSLWTISEKMYGDGRFFKAIGQHNQRKLPQADRLTAGTVIDVPPLDTLRQNYPDLCPKQRRSAVVKSRSVAGDVRPAAHAASDVYVVTEGDTLFDIARYELGKASRWGEIYELNRETLGEDFDFLPPGLELRMPPRDKAVRAAAPEPNSRYQR